MSNGKAVRPAEVLRSTAPPDDAGAETADRFEWQAMMATADMLSAYYGALSDDGLFAETEAVVLICEHHEDWAITRGSEAELTSAKHRDRSVARIGTIKALFDEGGVLHLFNRWAALGETPKCRLVTSGALASHAKRLADVCALLRKDLDASDESARDVVTAVCDAIAAIQKSRGRDQQVPSAMAVRRFLTSLSILDQQAHRRDLPDLAPERYGRDIAKKFGRPEAARAVWEAVLGLVRMRMRNAGLVEGGGLPIVLGAGHGGPLDRRSLALADVDTAVRFAVDNFAGYQPLPRVVKANKMAVKMARGGCSDNAIERADVLRLQYRRYLRTIREGPSTTEKRQRLENLLLRIVDDATAAVITEHDLWGADLWRELDRRVQAMEVDEMSGDLLLGGVSELANTCKAWFSARFEAGDELQRMLDSGAAS